MGDLVQGVFPQAVSRGWTREQRLWWLLWSRCPGIGWVRLRQLFCRCDDWSALWSTPTEMLAALGGWSPGLAQQVDHFRSRWGPDPMALLLGESRPGVAVLVPGDRRWPRGLRRLQRPPLALYWRGQGTLWAPLQRRLAVAVVGTRRPSPHGMQMARNIGAALAEAGWPVVSGLAEGIDAAAHQGCLRHGGRPVAVLGTPLDRVYPRHHSVLQRQVSEQGLLVSEQPPGTVGSPGHFAIRNRLQVALAAALVVVECPEISGALHSAELAWKEELPLWVVPADAGKASAAGSNRLLARGATPLISPADLIGQLGSGPIRPAARSPSVLPTGVAPSEPAPSDRSLLEAVGNGACLDQLCLELGQSTSQLAAQLLRLELSGHLTAEPGLCWRPR